MMTHSKHQHWLIDSATSVLKNSFITRYLEDDSFDLASSLPFSGPVQLPTKMQALKLFWFIKDEVSRYNSWGLSKGKIFGIGHYWDMEGYEAVSHSSISNLVKRIMIQYETLFKSKTRNQPKANFDREAFLAYLKTCLFVGCLTRLTKSLLRGKLLTSRGSRPLYHSQVLPLPSLLQMSTTLRMMKIMKRQSKSGPWGIMTKIRYH